jgi:hypothetical protein
MSGLSGLVIGYYLGRIPREAHTARAQDQLHQMVGHMGRATTVLEGLEEKVASGGRLEVDDVRRVRRTMSPR